MREFLIAGCSRIPFSFAQRDRFSTAEKPEEVPDRVVEEFDVELLEEPPLLDPDEPGQRGGAIEGLEGKKKD